MKDNEITYQIRGAIYDVYVALGPGLLESVYEEALAYELQKRNLKVERQKDVPILYDGQLLNTPLRLDMLVEDRVVVELKSVKELQDVFFKQTRTYLRLLGLNVGLLVNFNTDNILKDSIYRVVNDLWLGVEPPDTMFLGPAEPTEQREQNQACLSFAESRRRKTIVK